MFGLGNGVYLDRFMRIQLISLQFLFEAKKKKKNNSSLSTLVFLNSILIAVKPTLIFSAHTGRKVHLLYIRGLQRT